MKRLRFLTTFFIFFTSHLWSSVTQVNYKATFGIFGTVGTIHNTLTQNKKTYKIETTVMLAGLAKIIMGGQTEHYISKGHMVKGMMVSDNYTMISLKKDEKKVKEYHIDHKHKRVTKIYKKWKNQKLIVEEKKVLKFYAKNDLLTLYFNMNHALTKQGKTYHFKAVGLEKQKGIVQVTVPSDSQSTMYQKDLGPTANWYAKALIVQENFRKNKGDILLSVDEDGFIKKAVIKDVLMYGDAKLIRMK